MVIVIGLVVGEVISCVTLCVTGQSFHHVFAMFFSFSNCVSFICTCIHSSNKLFVHFNEFHNCWLLDAVPPAFAAATTRKKKASKSGIEAPVTDKSLISDALPFL